MAEYLPEVTTPSLRPVEAEEEILAECEIIWKQMQECQSKLMLLETETLLKSDAKLSLLMMRMKALMAEYTEWQKRTPEIISTNTDVLLASGKEELKKVKNDLEMVLATVQLKNKQLKEDLEREQQWHQEQQQILDALNEIEEETKNQLEQIPRKSLSDGVFYELQNKILQVKKHKEELSNALGEFLEEHFPIPENVGSSKKKKKSSEKPDVKLISLNEILELLINKTVNMPHEPYVTIRDSFWPPYVELLLRYGIAMRHPEDPNRMRLEAFHM